MNALVSPNLLENLRAYSKPFNEHPPVIVTRFEGGANPLFPFTIDSDRGLGVLLLCAALYRPGGEAGAGRTVSALYEQLGNDVFKLNRLPVEILQKAVGSDGEEQKRIPGILRSVCDFFYKTGSLSQWLASDTDWEKCVNELAAEIYWMGRHSQLRTKSRYFFWLASFQPEFVNRFPQAMRFCWPVGEGHLRLYHNILSPKTKQSLANPEKRLHVFSEITREIFPDAPWTGFQPMDAYLRPEKEHEYLCRKVQGGCNPCPLRKFCPAAKFFTE